MRTSAPQVAAKPSIPRGRDDCRPRPRPRISQVRPTRTPPSSVRGLCRKFAAACSAHEFRASPHYPDLLAAVRVYMEICPIHVARTETKG